MWIKTSKAWINLAQVAYVKESRFLGYEMNEPGIVVVFTGDGGPLTDKLHLRRLDLTGEDAEHVRNAIADIARSQWSK